VVFLTGTPFLCTLDGDVFYAHLKLFGFSLPYRLLVRYTGTGTVLRLRSFLCISILILPTDVCYLAFSWRSWKDFPFFSLLISTWSSRFFFPNEFFHSPPHAHGLPLPLFPLPRHLFLLTHIPCVTHCRYP